VLLCFYRRQTGTAKAKTGFLAKQKKNAEARDVQFFTTEEVANLESQELDEALDDPEGRTTADVMQELYSSVASNDIPATQAITDVIKHAEFMEEKAAMWEEALGKSAKASRSNGESTRRCWENGQAHTDEQGTVEAGM
jgi:hypothetical protein